VRDQLRDLQAVTLESDSPGVAVPTIELDGDAKISPQKVHLVAVDPGVGLKAGDARTTEQSQQRTLATGSRALGTTGEIEDAAQFDHAAFALVALQLSSEFAYGGESPKFRLGDEALQLLLI